METFSTEKLENPRVILHFMPLTYSISGCQIIGPKDCPAPSMDSRQYWNKLVLFWEFQAIFLSCMLPQLTKPLNWTKCPSGSSRIQQKLILETVSQFYCPFCLFSMENLMEFCYLVLKPKHFITYQEATNMYFSYPTLY